MASVTPKHKTKSDFAYEELRSRILSGALPVGERLRLRPLAADLGLSEMPIREAVRRLQEEGLVRLEPHYGATVTEISVEEVVMTLDARMWLEILAVRQAIPRHTPRTIAVLERALEHEAKARDEGNPTAFAAANQAFHHALEAPADEIVTQLIDGLWAMGRQVRRQKSIFELDPERVAGAHQEHLELLAFVQAGDVEGAAQAMAEHRARTLAAWRTALGTRDLGAAEDGAAPIVTGRALRPSSARSIVTRVAKTQEGSHDPDQVRTTSRRR